VPQSLPQRRALLSAPSLHRNVSPNLASDLLVSYEGHRFDQAIHTAKETINANEKWNQLRESVSLVKGFEPSQYKPGYGAVGHFAGGYDAQYYGYAYSLVFAYDMYQTVFKPNPLDPVAGMSCSD
jgi:Zn-dependent oligopeptidase